MMKKQKDPKQDKKMALMSFLQTSTKSPSQSEVTQQSTKNMPLEDDAYEEYTQQFSNCNVCGIELEGAKKKKCQFCSMLACNDHMRKRRKKKGKWQRICDHCQDRYIYDVYMKLQSKAQESIAVQQQITLMKHQNFFKEVEERREKRRSIGFKTMALQQKHDQEISDIVDKQNRLMSLQHQVESSQLSVKQLEVFVERASSAFKQNCEEDWNILSQENTRMAKQLAKLQKKCTEIRSAIEKREKDIEQAFLIWQQKQFKNKLDREQKGSPVKKKQNCQIF